MIFRKKISHPHEGHGNHLCYLVNMRFNEKHPSDYMKLVNQGQYMCKHCGRVAVEKKLLCKPAKLRS